MTAEAVRARFSQGAGIYRIVPQAVARPQTLEQLVSAYRDAVTRGMPITPRGAGTAMDGSNVGGGLVLDMRAFGGATCRVDPVAQTAVVSPGTTIAQLNQAAAQFGLWFPVDPSSSQWATLGGAISTNASGPHAIRLGSIGEWVRAVALFTGEGVLQLRRGVRDDRAHPVHDRWQPAARLIRERANTIHDRYPRVNKNSAGYRLDRYLRSGDLLDVVIGSEGTLGAIISAEVILAAKPSHRLALRAVFHHRDDITLLIEIIRDAGAATIELLDASFLRIAVQRPAIAAALAPLEAGAGVLLADFEGDDMVELRSGLARAVEGLKRRTVRVDIAEDPAAISELWSIRHGASPALAALSDGRRSIQVIEDACVPVHRMADYLATVERIATEQRIDAVMFGHAGDGHVHVNLLPNTIDQDWLQRVRAIYEAVSDTVIRLGGTVSGEHGAGRLRAGLLQRQYGADVVQCFAAVKAAFDPDNRWNPGVVVQPTTDPLTGLKVGGHAAMIDPVVEAQLARIEREAAWGESRWEDSFP